MNGKKYEIKEMEKIVWFLIIIIIMKFRNDDECYCQFQVYSTTKENLFLLLMNQLFFQLNYNNT
ncbi:unnamed protein product [Schistosoma margrebowiei]|uniref:Uncharacterized protein n=1 Tax=Schistosoma margrebowiei TaxID=48269 RepID=A0A183LWZ2_9TREM|nr:unnamed protein product [Schistosoma margrebowiei]